MVDRSPNFPSLSLGDAVEAIKRVFAAEGRSKVPRLSVVKPLGYTSINGRSLGVLAALKAYGLIEGRGDELRISQEGFILANAPAESTEYREALLASFRAPSAFQRFEEEDEGASSETLKWKLQKGGFQADSAERLVRVYRESRELLSATKGSFDGSDAAGDAADPTSDEHRFPVKPEPIVASRTPNEMNARYSRQHSEASSPERDTGEGVSAYERVLQSGMLSKSATFRVVVSGQVGVPEIERLIKKLEMDKEILADADPLPAMPTSLSNDPDTDAAYEQWRSEPN